MASVTRKIRSPDTHPRESVASKLIGAMERLLDQGEPFTTLSVEQLAAEAGIARSTFYVHFRDKSELVASAMTQVADEFVASTGAWLASPETADLQTLRQAYAGSVQVYMRHRAVVNALIETAAYDPTLADALRNMVEIVNRRVRHAISRIQAQGRARAGAGQAVGDVLTWSAVFSLYSLAGDKSLGHVENLADSLAHITYHAIFED